MLFRLANKNDLDPLMNIVNQAVANFKKDGINQWQKGYPNADVLAHDIEQGNLYTLEDDGRQVGMLYLAQTPDPSYSVIDGQWMNDCPYTTFHRVCVLSSCRGKGYAGILFREAEDLSRKFGFSTVRIDTHEDNIAMQHALSKAGYQFCGGIKLATGPEAGAPRIAFQKEL